MLANWFLSKAAAGVDLTPASKIGGRGVGHNRNETYDQMKARQRRNDLAGGLSEHSFNYSGISL